MIKTCLQDTATNFQEKFNNSFQNTNSTPSNVLLYISYNYCNTGGYSIPPRPPGANVFFFNSEIFQFNKIIIHKNLKS